MIALPNLRHLRAFQAVARLGSVGQASASINISQPAVTQAIAKLEYQIGAPGFDRRNPEFKCVPRPLQGKGGR